MNKRIYSVIIGTGSYIPTKRVPNSDFLTNKFYDSNGDILGTPTEEIIKKFEKISGISERRYVTDDLCTSDIAFIAANNALTSSNIDKETLDYIIVAHNFGDVKYGTTRPDFVPSIASRVKHKLGIRNSKTVAFDLPFGCPGWLQGMIHADYFLKSGDARKILVIGAETLSRISDPHDRDSMLYADGAGATILEAVSSSSPVGILSHDSSTDTFEEAYLLRMDKSYNPNYKSNELFLKMDGHKLYEYALKTVPQIVKNSIDKAGLSIADIKKVLIHQANEKMDEAILKRLFDLYDEKEIPQDIMPMTISLLGNSSVATVPTLLDLFLNNKLENHHPKKDDVVIFASVGAGMNINSMIYQIA